jgi:hypothetical protein
VVGGHLVLLAAFLMQADPPALALGVVVLDVHMESSGDTSERVDQERDQRAIAQADDRARIDALQQLPCFVAIQNGRRAFLDHMLWTAHGGGRILADDLADDQPAKCCLTVGAL